MTNFEMTNLEMKNFENYNDDEVQTLKPIGEEQVVEGDAKESIPFINKHYHNDLPSNVNIRIEVLWITCTVYMGYAACVTLQHELSGPSGFNLSTSSPIYSKFEHAVSFNYIGNLIFRLAHGIVFSFLQPRHRVYLSLCFMVVSMTLLGVFVCGMKLYSLHFIYLSYLLCGCSVGTYSANMISILTPFGHSTKVWCLLGMPIGFTSISVGGQLLLTLGIPVGYLFVLVLICIVIGMVLFYFRIPDIELVNNSRNLTELKENLSLWREWFPKMKYHCIAIMINMWALSCFVAMMYWIIDAPEVPLLGVTKENVWLLNVHGYFLIYNTFIFFGDFFGRKLIYVLQSVYHPFLFLLSTSFGVAILLTHVPLLAILGIFLVFFGNGTVYSTTIRFIDTDISDRYNLISLSVWLFLGDVGSVIGSNSWQEIQPLICHDSYQNSKHFCVNPLS